MIVWLILLIIALAGILTMLQSGMLGVESIPSIPAAIAVIAVLVIAYMAASRQRSHAGSGGIAGNLAVALLLATGAIAGGIYFASRSGILSKAPGLGSMLAPSAAKPDDAPSTLQDGPRSVLLRKTRNGQFVARGEINGQDIDLIVDTGAASVMLRHADAERAGIDTSALAFTTPVETANGAVYAAPARIRTLSIGAIRLDGVEALVAKPGSLNENLLGMSFLRRLRSYNIAGDFMTLRQ